MPNGASAPDFTIEAALAGKNFAFSLANALKKGPVVVYFYPKSFTAVCTEEAHEFAEASKEFARFNASIIGISADTIETQRDFSSRECRDKFVVGADPDLKIIRAFDAASPGAQRASRISYVIAPNGKILSSIADPGAEKHIQNALTTIKAWGRL